MNSENSRNSEYHVLVLKLADKLEVVELVIIHCNIINNNYQQDPRILYTFVPNKPFGSLLEILPTNNIFLKTFNSEFQEIRVWFTDQASKPLKVEDKINLTLIIK